MVRASKLQRLSKELLCGLNLAMLHGQNATSPDHIAACCFRRYLANLRGLLKLFLGFGEPMQTGISDTLERKDFNQRILVSGSSRRRIKDRQHLGIHTTP